MIDIKNEKDSRTLSQQDAPLGGALLEFSSQHVVRFDVPGHKGGRGNRELTGFLGEKCLTLDVNSMKPLDNLNHPSTVIQDAQKLAADAFCAANAFFMVGGTTSAVQAMIMSSCQKGDKIILPEMSTEAPSMRWCSAALSLCT